MVAASDPWESAENAWAYADFARRHSTYRQTSQDLVGLARLTTDAQVVDLACGTGITTKAVLAVLGERGTVVAVDASEAMLATASSLVVDERVTWLKAPAEHLSEYPLEDVDAVVCNSAIWQTDVRATAIEVHRVLRPGGRFVFNLATAMLADHADANQSSDPLMDLMKAIAAREHGWVARQSASARLPSQELSEGWLRDVLGKAGFQVEQARALRCQNSLEEQRAWLSIPIFTLRQLSGLSYEQRMTVLDQAYQRLADNRPEPATTEWMAFAVQRGE
jgi:ubiquinone/menaquinone biosynthesis C-methylase UbiE